MIKGSKLWLSGCGFFYAMESNCALRYSNGACPRCFLTYLQKKLTSGKSSLKAISFTESLHRRSD